MNKEEVDTVGKLDCTVIGDAMIDIILPLPDIENPNCLLRGDVFNTEAKISLGGTANVSVCVSKLGGKSAFIGKVGDDYFGKIFVEDLGASKVIKNVSMGKTKRTGIVFDLVFQNGERFFIIDRGANAHLRYEDIDFNLIHNSRFLYFAGFSFQDEETSETIQKVIRKASEKDITIVFNPGAPNLAKRFRDKFIDNIKKYVDILILNDVEAQHLVNSNKDNEIISFLLSIVDKFVLTKGNKGSIIGTQNEVHNIKAYHTKVVDTTGAGDAYAGAFIYGLSRGWRDDKTGKFASEIAGRMVARVGARYYP